MALDEIVDVDVFIDPVPPIAGSPLVIDEPSKGAAEQIGLGLKEEVCASARLNRNTLVLKGVDDGRERDAAPTENCDVAVAVAELEVCSLDGASSRLVAAFQATTSVAPLIDL